MKKFIFFGLWSLSFCLLGATRPAISSLPTGMIAPSAVGFVFPGFGAAAGINPSALAVGKKVTVAQAAYGLPITGRGTEYFASVSTSVKNTGWSLGYSGTDASGSLTHGMFAGVGFGLGRVKLGTAIRAASITGGIYPDVDLAAQLGFESNLTLVGVAYNLNSGIQGGLGVGFGKQKQGTVELSILMPATGSSNYRVTFGATLYSGPFGALFQTNYYLGANSFTHTLGVLFELGNSFNVLVELTTPSLLRTGLTILF